jgi:hypothetical protein
MGRAVTSQQVHCTISIPSTSRPLILTSVDILKIQCTYVYSYSNAVIYVLAFHKARARGASPTNSDSSIHRELNLTANRSGRNAKQNPVTTTGSRMLIVRPVIIHFID